MDLSFIYCRVLDVAVESVYYSPLMSDWSLYLHISYHIFILILHKILLMLSCVFLGPWHEVKKNPKTLIYLRIFKA